MLPELRHRYQIIIIYQLNRFITGNIWIYSGVSTEIFVQIQLFS